MRQAGVVGAVLLVVACFTSGDMMSARGAFPGANGVIAFNFANRSDIYAIRPDGTGLRKLVGPTRARGVPFSPAWSPDGKRLLFVRADRWDVELSTLDVVARRERRLGLIEAYEPSWSPSARELVVTVTYGDGCIGVAVIRDLSAPTLKRTRITGRPNADDVAPAWSPKGNWIAFARTVGTLAQTSTLYVVRPNGAGMRPLVAGNCPDWSPNGREIAFERDGDIFRVSLDGTGILRLTRSPRGETQPEWSPDGRKIAFARGTNLMVMNADGSAAHEIAKRVAPATGFDWQPLPRIAAESRGAQNPPEP